MEYKELKNEIKIKGLKYNYLAEQLNISRTSLYKKLNGITEFTVSEANKLSEILEIPLGSRKNFFYRWGD